MNPFIFNKWTLTDTLLSGAHQKSNFGNFSHFPFTLLWFFRILSKTDLRPSNRVSWNEITSSSVLQIFSTSFISCKSLNCNYLLHWVFLFQKTEPNWIQHHTVYSSDNKIALSWFRPKQFTCYITAFSKYFRLDITTAKFCLNIFFFTKLFFDFSNFVIL